MYPASRVYGLDIETDNSKGFGLVPEKSRITQVAVAHETGVEVLDHPDEEGLLSALNLLLVDLPPGLISTWNGAVFDLPFISDRARARQMSLGLRLSPDPAIPVKYDPLPGHQGGYVASWLIPEGAHGHLDVQDAYRAHAEREGVRHSLKPVMTSLGMDPVELDRTRLHEYDAEAVRAYVGSDATGARDLALRILLPTG